MPEVASDVVLLEQGFHSSGKSRDDLVLAPQHVWQLKLQLADLDTMDGELFLGFPEALARFQQCLAGDTADTEASPAQSGNLLDAAHIQTKLGCPNGRNITTRTRTDNDQVMFSNCRHIIPQACDYP